MKLESINRILILLTGGSGNMILFTPALRALREKFPEAHIALLVGPYGAEKVIERSPFVNEVIVYNPQRYHLFQKIKFVNALRKKGFVLTITSTGMNAFKSSFLSYLIRASYRVGEDIGKRGLFYNIKVPYNSGLHMVEGNLRLIQALGIIAKEKNPFIWITEEDRAVGKEFFKENGLEESRLVIGIHPGSGSYQKSFRRWPKERFAQAGDRLAKKYKVQEILVGGSEEVSLSEGIAEMMREEPIIATGKFTLSQTAAIIEKCHLFISNDSGLMHVAAAVGTPLVAIFGPTVFTRTGPYTKEAVIVRKNLKCSPCYRRGRVSCKRLDCLKLITVEDVLQAAEKLLKKFPR